MPVGALVQGKASYIGIAHVAITAWIHVSVSMNRRHYTNQGIIEQRTVGMNLSSADMITQANF